MTEYPKIMSKKGEYDKVHFENGIYYTTMPRSLVGKIGNSYPKKRAIPYKELVEDGYTPKI